MASVTRTNDRRCSNRTAGVNSDGASEEATWLALHSSGGAIQRALSCDSVTSEASVADFDNADEVNNKIGQLEFSVQYLRSSTELMLTVIQARDLERDHVTGSLDSYVRALLTPFTGSRSQTRIVRDSLCPQYLDSFVYRVPEDLLQSDSASSPVAQFQVYSCDKYARHRLLGEAEFRLADVDLRSEEIVRIWLNLHEIDERPVDRGDVLLSLSYLPTAERLILVVVKARNLVWPTTKPVGEISFKVYQLRDGSRVAKKKTSSKRDDSNPTFNEAMIFSVPQHMLETVQLKVSAIVVLPGDRGSATIGHLTIGPASSGTEFAHWTQAMASLRRPVTMWHRLR